MPKDSHLERISPHEVKISNDFEIDVSLYASADVPVQASAFDELTQMLELQQTVESFAQASPLSFPDLPRINRVALTPDFHKARGIPVGTVLETSGFVVPQAIGNDVNCGMRLHLTDLSADKFLASAESLESACRKMFFEAGRSIPMNRTHRESLLLGGITGLYDTVDSNFDEGLWSHFHRQPQEETLSRIEQRGSLAANQIFGLEKLLGSYEESNRDSQIGSIGGGNHFVEFQRVEKILDGTVAHAWGLKVGMTTIMVHTGSVSVGQRCGSFYRDEVRKIYPKAIRHPENGIFVLPLGERHAETAEVFWNALHNAGNFAFANRMFLALMAWSSLESCFGELDCPLLYDSPHNMVWRETRNGKESIIHRKGASTARGLTEMSNTPFAYYGEPVLVPGSMGASSYILAGNGFAGTLSSAAHGAGRALSRGKAMKGFEREFEKFLQEFRIVTPVDLKRQDIKRRKEIVTKKLAELKQESPFAYKGIGPVIETIAGAGIARPVAELKPLMTIKG